MGAIRDPRTPEFLFHGTTTARIEGILAGGLLPHNCVDDVSRGHSEEARTGTYFAADYLCAGDYSALAEDRWGGEPLTLAIRADALDTSLLQPDDYDLADALADMAHPNSTAEHGAVSGAPLRPALAGYSDWRDVPWEISLSAVGQVMYAGPVALDDIFILEYPGWPQDRTPVMVPVLSSSWLRAELEKLSDASASRCPGPHRP